MGLRDVLRRLGMGSGGRERTRGVRRRRRLAERRPDVPTAQLGAVSPERPAPAAPATEHARPAAPLPPDPEPAPAAPARPPEPAASPGPAPASAAPAGDPGATRYHAIPTVGRTRVAGVLVAVEGELEGEVYRVLDGETRLGRAPDCDAVLASEWVSRHHARIKHQDGVFVIAPLSERNPTVVNDEPTEGAELKDGDFVRLGRTTLRFRSVA